MIGLGGVQPMGDRIQLAATQAKLGAQKYANKADVWISKKADQLKNKASLAREDLSAKRSQLRESANSAGNSFRRSMSLPSGLNKASNLSSLRRAKSADNLQRTSKLDSAKAAVTSRLPGAKAKRAAKEERTKEEDPIKQIRDRIAENRNLSNEELTELKEQLLQYRDGPNPQGTRGDIESALATIDLRLDFPTR